MTDWGEKLQQALAVLGNIKTKNTATKQTAVRWFNRLYYDLSQWNKEVVQLLRDYPGFKANPTEEELETYKRRFDRYARQLQLDYRGGEETVESDICARIEFLARRLEKDFAWLKEEDPSAFFQLQWSVGRVQLAPSGFEDVPSSMYRTLERLSSELFGHYEKAGKEYKMVYPDVDTARRGIEEYIADSERILQEVWQEFHNVGFALLSITEYDEALRHEGSLNPNIMVMGEVTVSENIHIKNVVGSVNVQSRLDHVTQTVQNAPSASESQKEQLTSLIEELKHALESVAVKQPEDAQRVLQSAEIVASEVAKNKPNKSFLMVTTEGLKEAAKAVEAIAPSVLNVANKIASFLARVPPRIV